MPQDAMENKHRSIPSMYHRRLVLIAAGMLILQLALTAQLFRLSVVEGSHLRKKAEAALSRLTFLPTYRGAIIDRQGRHIAVDRPGYAIAVNWNVISGTWPWEQAERQARKEIGAGRFAELSEAVREEEIERRVSGWEARVERLWFEIRRLGGLDAGNLAQRLDEIRQRMQRLRRHVWERQRRTLIEQFGDAGKADLRREPILEEREAHVVLPSVRDSVAFDFRALAAELPGMFEVQDARRRAYPWSSAEVPLDRATLPQPLRSDSIARIRVDGVADHLLGTMRDVWAEDVDRRPFRDPRSGAIDLAGYRPLDDRAGAFGLERALEDRLRGTRGQIERRIDTGERIRIEPQPGDDLQTTLDIALQARIQAILSHDFGLTVVHPFHGNDLLPDGWPLNSAAVVLEVETGEIVAMVSMPTLAMGEEMDERAFRVHQPNVHRAAVGIYPPGSIVKPLVLSAAASGGEHSISEPIECTGHFFAHTKEVARCWIFRDRWNYATHGPLTAEEAIARSCNIYFYTLADRLGIDRLLEWYRRFGLGSPLNIGLRYQALPGEESDEVTLLGESAGSLPSTETIAKSRAEGRLDFETIILGIGQGPITWTPLQAANAYATLARGGIVRDATLAPDDPRGSRPQRCEDLPLDARAVAATLEGLRRSVNEEYGTGHHIRYDDEAMEPIFNAKGVTVWGKTGTAQAPAFDINGDGKFEEEELRRPLDHAWFVGLVGPDDTRRPMFSIAVLVEYGGSGGRVAGPIANQIVHALQDEGYLPDE